MKKKLLAGLATGVFMFCIIGIANATVIFSDNFDNENNGKAELNYSDFTNWTISDGTVDLIGNGDWQLGQDSSHGLFIDMDGSTYNAGKMLSTQFFDLAAGDYSLSFDLAGNHRNSSPETVTVQANIGILSQNYSLARDANFSTFTEYFTLVDTTNISLSFEGLGVDNVGMLLDNVLLERVDPVPEPATMFLFGTGLAGLVGSRLRRKKMHSFL